VTTRDGGHLRVALYLRVSTDEQAKSGYSIADQRRSLPEHAERQGWRVVEEIADDGWSGSSPERPGIGRIYELAEAGEIDLVLATKRDRFFRSRYYRLQMDRDMEECGVRLVSLTDTGNRIGDGVLDDFAEWEREQITERIKNGKRSKAREGKVVGGHKRAYGYDFVRDSGGAAIGYEVNEAEMHVVRRIFAMVARGKGIRSVKDILDEERVPAPRGGEGWSRGFLRQMIVDELYKPHTTDELRSLGVSESVLGNLEGEAGLYGVYRFEGIPVPIPDAGIGLELVRAARRRMANSAAPSENSGRFWPLSGGILLCSGCGRRMQSHTVKKSPKSKGTRTYHYYRCQSITVGKADRCSMRKQMGAGKIEAEVWETVRRVMHDKPYVLGKIEEHFEGKRKELRRPGADMGSLLGRLDKIEKAWTKNKLAYEADALSVADLKARRTELDREREFIEREMERVRNREAELRRLDEDEAEMRERIEAGYGGLDDATPKKQREVYEDVRLRVEVGEDKVPHITGWFPVQIGDTRYTLRQLAENHRVLMGDSSHLPVGGLRVGCW
jgi:site-specific DNA recombinase